MKEAVEDDERYSADPDTALLFVKETVDGPTTTALEAMYTAPPNP